MAIKLKVEKGDSVKIITGDDKGKTGKVLAVYPRILKIVVEGCKVTKEAIKSGEKNPNGGLVSKEMPMDISNVARI